jgi:hypothetical protein
MQGLVSGVPAAAAARIKTQQSGWMVAGGKSVNKGIARLGWSLKRRTDEKRQISYCFYRNFV